MANFSYCQLVWMFSSAAFLKKIENFRSELRGFYTKVTTHHMNIYY